MTTFQEYKFAIVLYFSCSDEQVISQIIEEFRLAGRVNNAYMRSDHRPHISLSVHRTLMQTEAIQLARNIASNYRKQYVEFPYIGLFHGEPGALYLGVHNSMLAETHKELHQALLVNGIECWPLYLPDQWIPHCAILVDDDLQQVSSGAGILINKPLPGATLESVGVMGFDKEIEFELRD